MIRRCREAYIRIRWPCDCVTHCSITDVLMGDNWIILCLSAGVVMSRPIIQFIVAQNFKASLKLLIIIFFTTDLLKRLLEIKHFTYRFCWERFPMGCKVLAGQERHFAYHGCIVRHVELRFVRLATHPHHQLTSIWQRCVRRLGEGKPL